MKYKAELYYSPRHAAEKLDMQPRTIVRWIHEGKIKGVKLGRVWRIPHSEVVRLLGRV